VVSFSENRAIVNDLSCFKLYCTSLLSDLFGKFCMSFFLLYNHHQVYYLVDNDRMSISILSS
jgi:hypothetical protein